jgi:photosystem II stability/assembly factor-like uncharacterized protein
VYKSTDCGENWREVFRTLPDDPQVVYAGGDNGMGVYKSTNGGFSWEPKNSGITDLDISTIVVAPSNHSVVYVGGGRLGNTGRLYRSDDAGESWTDIFPPLPPPGSHFDDIAVRPDNEDVVFVACEGGPGNYGIWKSTDGGANWRHVYDSYYMYCLAISEITPDVMYAARSWGFYKSSDAGESWELIAYLPLPGPSNDIWSIAPHPSDPQVIYVSRGSVGIWASTNGGYDWGPKNDGVWVPDMCRTRLTWDAVDPQWVYSGSYDAGFYRSQDGLFADSCG